MSWLQKYIERWGEMITTYRLRSFLIALAFMIGVALLMRPSSSCLITPYTPLAIVDLELAFNPTRAQLVTRVWEQSACQNSLALSDTALEAAIINIIIDFAFLKTYTWFFIVLVFLSGSAEKKNFTYALVYVALVAGLMDVIENIAMLIFIADPSDFTYGFAVPASIKFGLILVIILLVILRTILRLVRSFSSRPSS
ncbi:MAG: hypothetical protein AB7O48_15915 [Cyclobacteriaceae bacterium]